MSLYKECGVYFSLERATATQFLKDAEKEKWEGIQGEWQQESPAKEYLDQVKSSADADRHSQNDEIWILCIQRQRLGGIQKNFQSW